MKKLNLFLFIIILIVFSNCTDKYEKVSVGNNISINIPVDFVLEENISGNENIFKAKSDNDELYIAVDTISGLDTTTMEHRKEIVEKNLNGFAKTINGKNIVIEDMKTEDDLILSHYSMEIEKHESLMTVYCKIVNQGSSFILLTFFTEKPASKASLKAKDMIFKSIKIE